MLQAFIPRHGTSLHPDRPSLPPLTRPVVLDAHAGGWKDSARHLVSRLAQRLCHLFPLPKGHQPFDSLHPLHRDQAREFFRRVRVVTTRDAPRLIFVRLRLAPVMGLRGRGRSCCFHDPTDSCKARQVFPGSVLRTPSFLSFLGSVIFTLLFCFRQQYLLALRQRCFDCPGLSSMELLLRVPGRSQHIDTSCGSSRLQRLPQG